LKNLNLLIVFSQAVQSRLAQNSVSFVDEYTIINEVFNNGEIKPLGPVKVFFLTSEIKFWPKIFESQQEDYFCPYCEGTFGFIKSNLSKLHYFIHNVMMTELDPSKLSENIALEKKWLR